LAEISLNKNIQEAYINLKLVLSQQKCRIAAEDSPTTVSAIQGSIWGTSPKTAQKEITFAFRQETSGSRISTTSKLTSAYIKLTLAGVAFSIALATLCAWIAIDLTNFASTGNGYWGWLAYTNGPFSHFEPDIAAVLIRVTWILSAFLVGTLIAEAVVVARVQTKINVFAQETLKALGN
jgi:hypothetical protein